MTKNYEIKRPVYKDSVFLMALLCAVCLHVVLLLLNFSMPTSKASQSQDITISLQPTDAKVEQADFLAPKNQLGGGSAKKKQQVTTDLKNAPETQTAGEQNDEQLEMLQQKQELQFQEKVLMTVLSWQKQSEEHERKKAKDQLDSQFQAKAAMVASLEAQFSHRQEEYDYQQHIKTVSGAQAKQDASAAYLDKFRQKVELYGNRYYPEQAKQAQLSGEVRLMVILNPEGGVRAIRLLDSSGSTILDEAAKNSVRRGAPFGKFDQKMQDISELRVIRTWRFDPADSEFSVK